MNAVIKILLESTIILSGFYAIYLGFHKDDKNFRFTRIYLIGSSFLSVLIPLLRIPILSADPGGTPFTIRIHEAIQLPEIIISGSAGNKLITGIDLSAPNLLLILYLTGCMIFLAKFLYELSVLLWIIYRNAGKTEERSFYKLVPTGGRLPTSSFFGYLLWDETMNLTTVEKNQIIRHEEGHIGQYHSFDILYLELLRILFWFNPFIHGYRKAMASVHEYLADEHAVKDRSDAQYLQLLARQALNSCNITLNNHFSRSLTLKRIRMIESSQRRSIFLRLSISLTISAIMFYFFSCETPTSPGHQEAVASVFPEAASVRIISPQEIKTASYRKTVADWIEKNTGKTYAIITSDFPQRTMSSLFGSGEWQIPSYYIDDTDGASILYAIATHEPEPSMASPEKEVVYSEVDVPPAPAEGIQSFFNFVSKNLKYPEEARNKGIEGKVFVEFVVATNGKVDRVRVAKGLDPVCDQEAVKVISRSPNWIPGYRNGNAVNVKMVLPITFALD